MSVKENKKLLIYSKTTLQNVPLKQLRPSQDIVSLLVKGFFFLKMKRFVKGIGVSREKLFSNI